jgi:hypothetical protein
MQLWLAIPALHVQKSALLSSATSDHCWKRQETFPLSSWFQAAASRIPQLHGPWLRLWPSPHWAAWTSTDKQIMQSVLWVVFAWTFQASMCVCVLLCLCVVMSPKNWTMPQENTRDTDLARCIPPVFNSSDFVFDPLFSAQTEASLPESFEDPEGSSNDWLCNNWRQVGQQAPKRTLH